MKREVIISVSILLVISVLFAGCIQLFSGNETKENLYLFPVSDAPSEVMAALDHFSESVYARCNELDVELTRAAADLSGIPRTEHNQYFRRSHEDVQQPPLRGWHITCRTKW